MRITEFRKGNYIEENDTLVFQSTPISKVIILSLLTSGFYDLFMFYSYWRTLRDKFGLKISCIWRTIFCNFTNLRLFPILDRYFKKYNMSLLIGFAWIYLFSSYMATKLTLKTINYNTTHWGIETVILLLTLICTMILAHVQHKINKINKEHFENAPQNPWKVSNYIWAVIMAVINILAYLPE